jgi:hypothetical protein
MVMIQNISISSSSESSLRVASHVNARIGAPTRAETRGQPGSGCGSISVRSNGLVFDATYHPDPGGLEVVIRAFDLADPSGTRLDLRLLLRAGERRLVNVPRAHGIPVAKLELFCIDGGVQAFFFDGS